MNQQQRRDYLIRELLKEQPGYWDMTVPEAEAEQKRLLRALMNVRIAAPITETFAEIQDAYLQEENHRRGIVDYREIPIAEDGIHLWQGDITRLRCGAIVNAANSGMTGCYRPNHICIDNCIHTYAGIQLRNYCFDLMQAQGHEEPIGCAKITPAFNLPCEYVIHTVGPIVYGELTAEHEAQLISCYRKCLETAKQHQIDSIAFCCISTGVFMFPAKRAAELAIQTVRSFRAEYENVPNVIFDVFTDEDFRIYRTLLQKK